MLGVGDPAPWFAGRTAANPEFHFDTIAGRYVVLCFFGSAGNPAVAAMLGELWRRTDVFDGRHAMLWGVSCDAEDERTGRIADQPPGCRVFWDFDFRISALYGICERADAATPWRYSPTTVILDPNLRVLAVFPFPGPGAHATRVADYVSLLPRWGRAEPGTPSPPILICPRVFEPAFCRELIALYERHGGEESGVMRTDPVTGQTIGVMDRRAKQRRDYTIMEPEMRQRILAAFRRRLFPEVHKAFQFEATQVERYLIACYSAEEGGHFGSHRDNLTKMTSHRQFAVTVNLNAEEYEGGGLRFPEYDRRVYWPPTGGALVFSCTVLHEATPVTKGRRYCLLPFLEGAAAAIARQRREAWPGYHAPHLGRRQPAR